jgi:hypothetical protein
MKETDMAYQTLQIRPAQRKKSKMRLGIAAPSGAGKTYSSLLIAQGLAALGHTRIGVIDTENGSADLYADLVPDGYDVITLTAPYSPARYVEAIHLLEQSGHGVIIIDSLTHAWSGEGGALDRQGKIADKSGNSWAAWRQVTPEHNALVEAMLQSPSHIIATMRSKTEYVQEKDDRTGKMTVRKVGLAPVMRDGIEYEFTVFMELTHDHTASASKDRTRLFSGEFFTPDVEIGEKMHHWLESGAPVPIEEKAAQIKPFTDEETVEIEDWLRDAASIEELFQRFSTVYKRATALSDAKRVERFTKIKDEAKARLESKVTS